MKCALAALGFINEDLQYNKQVIINTMAQCSQMTIDAEGRILDVFRRISPGWKEYFSNDQYCEEIARVGSAVFRNGNIRWEIPSGKDDILIVEI